MTVDEVMVEDNIFLSIKYLFYYLVQASRVKNRSERSMVDGSTIHTLSFSVNPGSINACNGTPSLNRDFLRFRYTITFQKMLYFIPVQQRIVDVNSSYQVFGTHLLRNPYIAHFL